MPSKFVTLGTTGEQRYSRGLTASAGNASADNLIATNSAGQIDTTFLPAGLEISTESIVVAEALAAGDLINIHVVTGTRTARKADASNGRMAHGYVLTSVANAGTATVYKTGKLTGKTGLTPGSLQFLSGSSAGGITAAPAMTSGFILQEIGYAVDATSILFEFDAPTYLDA